MRATISLLMALGMSSPLAMAQTSSPSQQPSGTPAQSDLGMPPQPGITSPSTSGGTGDTPASGAGDGTTGSSGTSPVDHAASRPDASSGASGSMQSEAGMELQPAPSMTERLKPVVQNDVTYLCGGVGEEEANYMKQEARGYDLMLTFAAKSGAYLADVNVDIKDAKGNSVLQASCDSPMLLVDLPKTGTYRVHADASGYTLDKTVRVAATKKKGQHLASAVLVWPQQVAEAPGSAPTSGGSEERRNGASGTSNDNGVDRQR